MARFRTAQSPGEVVFAGEMHRAPASSPTEPGRPRHTPSVLAALAL